MSRRFFASSPDKFECVQIVDQEAHHLINVMRAKVGDQITTFDGTGFEYEVELTKMDRKSATATVLSKAEVSRELPIQLTLGVALPKGDRQKWLVEKCVELGVTHLVPLETKFGVSQPVTKALDRLRRNVIEASKQCERNLLMQIETPQSLEQFLSTTEENVLCLFADPSAEKTIAEQLPKQNTNIKVAIGPEGGFSPVEIELANSNNWQAISLGPRILRIETAALAVATVIAQSIALGE